MKSLAPFAIVLMAACLVVSRPCGAQTDPTVYELSSPPSEFEWGCFGPCKCPILVQSPMTGSFILRRSHSDPLFTYYDVLDVHWKVPGASAPVTITGSGTYRRGGEVAAEEELALDLSFNGAPPRRFASGLVPPRAPFPEISIDISLHGEYCLDSVVVVDAKPVDPVGVGEAQAAPAIVATPNPFAAGTALGFTMPREGPATLAVFDVGGRRARTLLEGQWLPAGPAACAWDGRDESGTEAPPGLYVVRLETPAGRFTRLLVKLR